MEIWNKYKEYFIGLIITVLIIGFVITYVELTSSKKAEILIKPQTQQIDSLFKIIKQTNNTLDSLKKNITKTEYIINVKESNYKKIINEYQKDSVAIANYDRDSINSYITRELNKRKGR